ncbi:hypothetical protein KBTX_01689 [wastewater metagenome]|uniref:Zinc finger CHC2-type domain-containing protein n=2 Tax=unclassified sequences TaxID=12908 RepID=A0A5B8RBN3_9ZZZZ|nr:hypothetical protein [Arhodomonas sp. KWT]QEA05368.1 hypothetical protein KBTEX_01689 [uncultured organism]
MSGPQKRKRPGGGPGASQHSASGTASQSTAWPAATLLPRLERVRELGPGRWIARCPAHDDRSPSLSVRETDDATILVHCWAGCPSADVVAALGLELSDLFPPRRDDRAPLRPRERWVPRDVLAAVAGEALVVAIAADDLAAGRRLADADRERLRTASLRLRAAAREVGVDG